MPVHLTGRVCKMNEIKKISNKYKIPILEDAAQSIGSKYYNKNLELLVRFLVFLFTH